MTTGFTHLNEHGHAHMVDVTTKPATVRVAIARSRVTMKPETLAAIRNGVVTKGDVLAVAQVAGVMAAKKTGDWIPMCHPLPITGCDLRFRFVEAQSYIEVEAKVVTFGKTGVEMEALTAASTAALTIYDMAKALDPAMVIGPTWLFSKEGGKNGPFRHPRKDELSTDWSSHPASGG